MSENRAPGKLYLIERIGENLEYRFYAEHGEMGGIPDAIGYDTAAYARKFRTEAEAQTYIGTRLPEWARGLHPPVALGAADFLWTASALPVMLQYGMEIPDEVLEPVTGRLRLWRCGHSKPEFA